MKILGISAFYHDSAAALLVDGKIVASAQEERFTRIKHDKSYPKESIKFCLDLFTRPGKVSISFPGFFKLNINLSFLITQLFLNH